MTVCVATFSLLGYSLMLLDMCISVLDGVNVGVHEETGTGERVNRYSMMTKVVRI